MADVTISSLTQGIPSGSHILPFSTGSSTLGTPISALFQAPQKLMFFSSPSGAPVYDFHILKNGYTQLIVGSKDGAGAGIWIDGGANGDAIGGDYCGFWHTPDRQLKIYNNQIWAVNILSGGNVGIGTEAPLFKLHVKESDQNKIASSIAGMEFGERTFTFQANTWYDVSRGDIHGMYVYKLVIGGDIGGVAYRYHEMGFNKSYPSLVNTVWGKNTGFPSDPGVQWQVVNSRYQIRITNSSWSGTGGYLTLMGSLVSM